MDTLYVYRVHVAWVSQPSGQIIKEKEYLVVNNNRQSQETAEEAAKRAFLAYVEMDTTTESEVVEVIDNRP